MNLKGTDFRPERADFRSEGADSRPERADFRPERVDFRPERADFRPLRADFRPMRAWGDERTERRKDRRTNESPPVSYRTLSFSGPLPKNTFCPAWLNTLKIKNLGKMDFWS